jgi:hypothetical protein
MNVELGLRPRNSFSFFLFRIVCIVSLQCGEFACWGQCVYES